MDENALIFCCKKQWKDGLHRFPWCCQPSLFNIYLPVWIRGTAARDLLFLVWWSRHHRIGIYSRLCLRADNSDKRSSSGIPGSTPAADHVHIRYWSQSIRRLFPSSHCHSRLWQHSPVSHSHVFTAADGSQFVFRQFFSIGILQIQFFCFLPVQFLPFFLHQSLKLFCVFRLADDFLNIRDISSRLLSFCSSL